MPKHYVTRLTAALRAGQGAERLYDEYGIALFGYCWAMLGDSAEAAGALTDTVLVATAHADALDDPGDLTPWIFALARNECLRRRPEAPPAASPYRCDPYADVLTMLVARALTDLRPTDRELIDLTVRYRLSIHQLARVLDLDEDRVARLAEIALTRFDQTLSTLFMASSGRLAVPREIIADRPPLRVLLDMLPPPPPPADLRGNIAAACIDPELDHYRQMVARRVLPLGENGFPHRLDISRAAPPPETYTTKSMPLAAPVITPRDVPPEERTTGSHPAIEPIDPNVIPPDAITRARNTAPPTQRPAPPPESVPGPRQAPASGPAHSPSPGGAHGVSPGPSPGSLPGGDSPAQPAAYGQAHGAPYGEAVGADGPVQGAYGGEPGADGAVQGVPYRGGPGVDGAAQVPYGGEYGLASGVAQGVGASSGGGEAAGPGVGEGARRVRRGRARPRGSGGRGFWRAVGVVLAVLAIALAVWAAQQIFAPSGSSGPRVAPSATASGGDGAAPVPTAPSTSPSHSAGPSSWPTDAGGVSATSPGTGPSSPGRGRTPSTPPGEVRRPHPGSPINPSTSRPPRPPSDPPETSLPTGTESPPTTESNLNPSP